MINTFSRPPPHIEKLGTSKLCTITSGNSSSQTPTRLVSSIETGQQWAGPPINKIMFLFAPPRIVRTLVMPTLNLPRLTLGILIWYLTPPTPSPTPQLVLTLVKPIATSNVPPTVVSLDSPNPP